MSKKQGQEKALAIVREKLAGIDIEQRLELSGIPNNQKDDVKLRVFGNEVLFNKKELTLVNTKTRERTKAEDEILFLHYLLNDIPVKDTNEFISFRELPGGQFYWNPFKSRTVKPLAGRMRNNLDLLKEHLARFDWEESKYGDFSAKIHALGNLYIVLVYHLGDEEFTPSADVLLPKDIKHVYNAEDAAILASRICLGLL